MPNVNKLKSLEDRLNSDDSLRNEFLKDPVKVLEREGVDLTPEMAKSVKAQFRDLQVPKVSKLAKAKVRIKITITIRF